MDRRTLSMFNGSWISILAVLMLAGVAAFLYQLCIGEKVPGFRPLDYGIPESLRFSSAADQKLRIDRKVRTSAFAQPAPKGSRREQATLDNPQTINGNLFEDYHYAFKIRRPNRKTSMATTPIGVSHSTSAPHVTLAPMAHLDSVRVCWYNGGA